MEKGETLGDKVESHSVLCSVKQSLIGLHKDVMSLSIMHTPSCDDDKQTLASSTSKIFFSSVPEGVFNLVISFSKLEEFVKLK